MGMNNLIYKVTNLINGKIYIGSTTRSLARRWAGHQSDVKKGSPAYLHKAIRKYGKSSFKIEPICCVLERKNIEIMESHFIEIYNTKNKEIGYNQHDPIIGNSEYIGEIHRKSWADPESRRKRIAAMTKGSQKSPIIAVHVDSAAITRYESIQSAMRAGFSASSVCNSLNKSVIKGQKNVWFYDNGQEDSVLIEETRALLGGFKTNNTRMLVSQDLTTGLKTYYNTIAEVVTHGYLPKQVNRVLSGKRKTFDNKTWTFVD